MGFSYNNGQVTPMKGTATVGCYVTFGASGAVAALVDKGKSGFFALCVKTATGRYTFTVNSPLPASVVNVIPKLSLAASGDANRDAKYIEGSYSASAGTFEIDVRDATPALADPVNGSALHVEVTFQRYTNI